MLVILVFKSNIYGNCSQQNGELIFGISLEMKYDNISLKASEYLDIHWSNQMNIQTLKTTICCRTNEFKLTSILHRFHVPNSL